MTTDLGSITTTATCQSCDSTIHFIRWTLGEDRWLHDGTSDKHCPNSPVAVPRPGTIVETGEPA